MVEKQSIYLRECTEVKVFKFWQMPHENMKYFTFLHEKNI